MIFERSPSAYFSQRRSESIDGKGVTRHAHDRPDLGTLERVQVAEPVQVIPRKAEWRRLGRGSASAKSKTCVCGPFKSSIHRKSQFWADSAGTCAMRPARSTFPLRKDECVLALRSVLVWWSSRLGR